METRVCRLYGPHDLRIETDTVPAPGQGEVMVAIGAGGICGSDLHYYHEGGFGPIRVNEPIILGHEIAGTVEAVGSGVHTVKAGDRVALNPSRPCHACRYCEQGLHNHCLSMRFYGSAMRLPHEQGGFRDRIIAEATQCVRVERAGLSEAACAEPLAVCLHATGQVDSLKDRTVLITGAGPIGVLCAAIARHRGAAEIIVTDIEDTALAMAQKMGATRIVNVARDAEALEDLQKDKGRCDIAFECSAAASAIHNAIACTRPRGTVVEVGVGGETPIPLNLLVGKEIVLRGTHRFHEEFAEAVRLIDTQEIDVKPMITDSFPLERAVEAFDAASDRSQSTKVHLTFGSVA